MFGIEFMIQVGFPLILLIVTFFIGNAIERRHYASIEEREQEYRALPAMTLETTPPGWIIEESTLCTGNVVVSVDYFKRFLCGLRGLIGGRVKTYETLLDRARREALIRLKQSANESGCRVIINVRLETSRMASGGRDGKGTAGVEVLAFGTGLRLRSNVN